MRHQNLALTLLISGACAATEEAPGMQNFVSIAKGVNSGITTPGAHAARDADQWQALWAEHARIQVPAPPPPQVDFERNTVVFVSAGSRPTGGYALAVERAEVYQGKLSISARESAPQPGSMLTQALTAPFEIVLVPRTALPVEAWIRH